MTKKLESQEYLTPKAFAELHGVSERTVRAWVKKGKVKQVKRKNKEGKRKTRVMIVNKPIDEGSENVTGSSGDSGSMNFYERLLKEKESKYQDLKSQVDVLGEYNQLLKDNDKKMQETIKRGSEQLLKLQQENQELKSLIGEQVVEPIKESRPDNIAEPVTATPTTQTFTQRIKDKLTRWTM